MLKQRVVGWIDGSEWDAVYYNLYYGDGRHIQDALDQIAVWRARMGDRIPVAVESTAHLFQCRMRGDKNDPLIQQSMAMAITQFVGLLTEQGLRGCASNVPIHKRAQMMGIPEWVTNLRHESAHGLLPSYKMLSKGVDFSLNWLKVHHWDQQYRAKCESNDKKETLATTNVSKEDIASLLRHCVSAARKIPTADPKALKNFHSTILSKPGFATKLSEVIVENNFLPCYKGDEVCPFYSKVPGQGLALYASVFNLYKKIFTSLSKNGAMNNILMHLTNELKSSSTSEELCYLWLDLVLGVLISTTSDGFECVVDLKALVQELKNHDVLSTLREKVTYLSNVLSNFEDEDIPPESSPTDSFSPDLTSKSFPSYHGDIGNCPLGTMPGQDTRTLWQSLTTQSLPVAEMSDYGAVDSSQDEQFAFTPMELQFIAAQIDLL